jgi:hypothetical protein
MTKTMASLRRGALSGDRFNKVRSAAPAGVTRTRQDYVREIDGLWADARQRFLEIGRRLVEARSSLPHGEYIAMIEQDLPFSRSVAFQLRAVAEAVSGGILLPNEVPGSYSTAFQLVSLKPEEIQVARQEKLVRADVRREDIIAFKKRLRGNKKAECDRVQRLALLRAERERLEARMREVDAEIAQLENEA